MSLKVIFAGTPAFAEEILRAFLHSSHKILAVFTQPDRPKGRGRALSQSPVKQLAEHHHIPVFQPENLKNPEIQKTIRDLEPDIFIVVAYGLIIPKAILDMPKYGCINVHASLLPRHRGASPIQSALLAGDALTGITIMQMDVGLDTGDILAVYPCPIEIRETSESLHQRLASLGANLLLSTINQLEEGGLEPQKQDDAHATYASKIKKEDARINWQESSVEIDRKIRAYNPWPVAFTCFLDHQHQLDYKMRVFGSEVVSMLPGTDIGAQMVPGTKVGVPGTIPGTIVNCSTAGIDVMTGSGVLRLTELQLPSGKRMSSQSLLHSKKDLFKIGTRLV